MLVSKCEFTWRWKHLERGQSRWARGTAEGSRGLGGREGSELTDSLTQQYGFPLGPIHSILDPLISDHKLSPWS